MFIKNKKSQLGLIEFRFLMIGLIIGIILAVGAIYMANNGILIPFKMSFVCGV
jgi:type III secretory pathway component EscR